MIIIHSVLCEIFTRYSRGEIIKAVDITPVNYSMSAREHLVVSLQFL